MRRLGMILTTQEKPLWIILLLGVGITILKCMIVGAVSHIGHNDAMGYAEMADSMLHGRGLSVDYVSFHFIQYPSLPRPEDHWPPLYALLILPFYLVLGKTAIAFKLPSLIIASLVLPAVTYAFARQLRCRSWTAFGAALSVQLYPKLFFWSLFSLSDITYTCVFLLVLLFTLKGFDDGRSFYFMGVALGAAYYAKGSALLLIPAILLFAAIRLRSVRAVLTSRRLLLGVGLALLIILPFWIRNSVHYDNPMHSTQTYWAGHIGYSIDGPSNGNTYRVYWDGNRPTWAGWKLPLGWQTIGRKTWEYFDTQFQWAFVRMGRNEPVNLGNLVRLKPLRVLFEGFPVYPDGIPIVLFGFPALLGLVFLWKHQDIYLIPIAFGSLLLFLSLMWAPIDRLILVSVPLVFALGWLSWQQFLDWVLRHQKHGSMVTTSVLLLLVSITSIYAGRSNIQAWQRGSQGATTSFQGSVDEVRIYSRALQPHEVTQNHAASTPNECVTKGLVSHWSFDEGTHRRGIIVDSQGKHPGSVIGNPRSTPGHTGQALHFDGNDSVEIPSTPALEMQDAFTIETWVMGDRQPTLSDRVTQWLAKGGHYALSWDHSEAYRQSQAFRVAEQGWPVAPIREPLQANTWYHVVGTWDGNQLRTYLDGKLSSETIVTGKPVVDGTALRIGGTSPGGWFPYRDGPFEREQLLAAKWIRENTPPDAVIMDCDPWALQFYSDRKCVHFACDTPEQIFRVMRHYGVTHITYDTYEAAHPKTLDAFYQGGQPGFRLVYPISPRLKIYEVQWDLLGSP